MSSPRPLLSVLLVASALLLAGCTDTSPVNGQAAAGDGSGDDATGPEPKDVSGDDTASGGASGSGGTGSGASTDPPNNTTDDVADGNETSTNQTAVVWPPESQATIRPGVQVTVGSSICTTNFLFKDPHNETYYLGIAAHCVYDRIGEVVHLSNAVGIIGSQGERIGKVVYSSYKELGIEDDGTGVHPHDNDFALVQLDNASLAKTHPSMKYFGGPTGIVASIGDFSIGSKLLMHGDTSLRPGPDEADRLEGYVTNTNPPWTINAYFVPYSFQGDSGSGVITADGQAAGILVSLAVTPFPGETGITFLPPAMAFAEASGFPLELVTWEQFEDGTLPG